MLPPPARCSLPLSFSHTIYPCAAFISFHLPHSSDPRTPLPFGQQVTQYHMLSKDVLLGSVKLHAGLDADDPREHHSDNWHTMMAPSGNQPGKMRVSLSVSVCSYVCFTRRTSVTVCNSLLNLHLQDEHPCIR
jgi:hypothetical protein